MIKERFVLAGVMLGFLSTQAWFVTTNDYITGVLTLTSAIIMYRVVFDLQASNRRVARVNTKEGGFLHSFLSKDKSIFTMVLSFIISCFMAVVLVLILKGLINNNGYMVFSIIILTSSVVVYKYLNNNPTTSKAADEELATDIGSHANKVLNILIIAFVLNLSLSAVLSAHDTYMFLTNNITFDNFSDKMLNDPHRVFYNGDNYISMVFMNIYIVMEKVKLAISSEILVLMNISLEDKKDAFYAIYASIFFLNMFKLFTFSFSFVLLQKGLERLANNCTPYVDKYIKKGAKKVREYTPVAKELAENMTKKTKDNLSKKVKDVLSKNKGDNYESEK